MSELRLPWLELGVLLPLIGAIWTARLRDLDLARQLGLIFSGLTFACAVGAWRDFNLLETNWAQDAGYLFPWLLGRNILSLDLISAPMLPLVALLHLLTILITSRTKLRRFSFTEALISDAIVMATFSCREPWAVICLLTAGTLVPYFELLFRRQPTRNYFAHMTLFISLMIVGWMLVEQETRRGETSTLGIFLVMLAMAVRCSILPFHGWMVGLFEHVSFGLSLLSVAPMVGIYGVVRLVVPHAPDWMLWSLAVAAMITAFYASGMSLVQNDARRFYCYLFLTHSSLILVGLGTFSEISTTGSLCIWISEALAMGGFGLTLRALEARCGRIYLKNFQGLYEHMPTLAVCFALTGLAAIGFPGTFGFVGMEILIDGVVTANPFWGFAVVIVGALNGIAIVRAFFRLFTGTKYHSCVSLRILERERYGVLALAGLILVGGIFPQSHVKLRHHAAIQLLQEHDQFRPENARVTQDAQPTHGWW